MTNQIDDKTKARREFALRQEDYSLEQDLDFKSLSPRHQDFVLYYLECLAPKKAALLAGYNENRAATSAASLLKKPKIIRIIERNIINNMKEISPGKVLKELEYIAFADPAELFNSNGEFINNMHDIPESIRRAIAGLKIRKTETTSRDGEIEIEQVISDIRFVSKSDAIDKLAKHIGLYQPERFILDKRTDGKRDISENELVEELKKRGLPTSVLEE
jgi:phage terminase small subunit